MIMPLDFLSNSLFFNLELFLKLLITISSYSSKDMWSESEGSAVMTPGIGDYQTNLLNLLRFSTCSVKAFKDFLLTNNYR